MVSFDILKCNSKSILKKPYLDTFNWHLQVLNTKNFYKIEGLSGRVRKKAFFYVLTGVSYKWYASVADLPNLFSVIDG